MNLLEILPWILLVYIRATAAVQIARVMPEPSGNVALMHRHNEYTDQRVRADPENILNHQDWHLRVVVQPPTAQSNSPPRLTLHDNDLHLLAMTQAGQDDEDSADWDQTTDEACISALDPMNGVTSNPSGIAACYNIESFDELTGAFQADLRIFQVSTPTDDWREASDDGFTIGLSYAQATVTRISSQNPRKDSRHVWSSESDEVNQSPRLRGKHIVTRKLGQMTLMGQVDGIMVSKLQNMNAAIALMRPRLWLSVSEMDGDRISTELSLQDASFVHGLFVGQGRNQQTASPNGASTSTLDAKNLTRVPLGLIIAGTWALLLAIMTGFAVVCRIRSRNAYRRGLKTGHSRAPSIISW